MYAVGGDMLVLNSVINISVWMDSVCEMLSLFSGGGITWKAVHVFEALESKMRYD